MSTNEHLTDEQREHLRELAGQARREMADVTPPPEEFGEESPEQEALVEELKDRLRQVEDHGYDIPTPPTPEEVEAPPEPERTVVPTAFLVFVDPESGRAVATSDVFETAAVISIGREATLVDMRRYLAEALGDVTVAIQTQASIQAQMQAARQIQEQMASAQVAAGLDLSKMRSQS